MNDHIVHLMLGAGKQVMKQFVHFNFVYTQRRGAERDTQNVNSDHLQSEGIVGDILSSGVFSFCFPYSILSQNKLAMYFQLHSPNSIAT